MVSIRSIITACATTIAAITTVLAAPQTGQANVVKRVDNICGTMPTPGIRQPIDGSTITYTLDQQQHFEGTTFQIVYCSGDYFKTASLNVTALLGDDASSGMVIGSAIPLPGAASAGYYGYIFDVTIYPISGNYLTGSKKLSIFEWETGYYNAYNFHVHTITINLEKEV